MYLDTAPETAPAEHSPAGEHHPTGNLQYSPDSMEYASSIFKLRLQNKGLLAERCALARMAKQHLAELVIALGTEQERTYPSQGYGKKHVLSLYNEESKPLFFRFAHGGLVYKGFALALELNPERHLAQLIPYTHKTLRLIYQEANSSFDKLDTAQGLKRLELGTCDLITNINVHDIATGAMERIGGYEFSEEYHNWNCP